MFAELRSLKEGAIIKMKNEIFTRQSSSFDEMRYDGDREIFLYAFRSTITPRDTTYIVLHSAKKAVYVRETLAGYNKLIA